MAELHKLLQEKGWEPKIEPGLCFLCTWSNGRCFSLAFYLHLYPYWMQPSRNAAGLMFSRKQACFQNFNAFDVIMAGKRYGGGTLAPSATHLLPGLSSQDLVTHYNPGALWLYFKLQTFLTCQFVENSLVTWQYLPVIFSSGIWGLFPGLGNCVYI